MRCISAVIGEGIPNLQRLAELGQAAFGGAISSKAGCGSPICARAVHVEDVAARALLPHHPDGLFNACHPSHFALYDGME